MVPDIGQSDGDAGKAVLYGAAEDRVVEMQVLIRPVLNAARIYQSLMSSSSISSI